MKCNILYAKENDLFFVKKSQRNREKDKQFTSETNREKHQYVSHIIRNIFLLSFYE